MRTDGFIRATEHIFQTTLKTRGLEVRVKIKPTAGKARIGPFLPRIRTIPASSYPV